MAATPIPPTARKVDAVDHQFGIYLQDPDRWMEGANIARKFAVRMRTATTSGKPVWTRTDAESGHLGGI